MRNRMPLTRSQTRAVAARGNVIVVAGAGTGKTSTLVERCLDLLRGQASLDRILMVTFTEAAAAEMRHRLRARLQDLADSSSDTSERERFAEQLALVESARISTLHSFCLSLVRSHFHELGIDPEPIVLDEHQCRVLAEETLDRLFQECYAGTQAFHEGVRRLVAAYAPDRDRLVREMVLQLHRYSQSMPNAQGWLRAQTVAWGSEPAGLREGSNSGITGAHRTPEPGRAPGCAALPHGSWEAWLVQGFTDWHQRWLPLIEPQAGIKNIDDCLEAMESVTREITRAQVAQVAGAVAAAGAASWPKGTAGRVRDPLNSCFDEARFLASVAEPGALEADWQAVHGHMQALLALTAEFTARFTRAKGDLGGVDFPDLEQLALQLLRDDRGQPTSAAEAVQKQFDYVFVDEYQDINAAQDAILSAISRTGADANRFLVGDVKQSIYQFRLADPQIFRRYEKDWGGGQAAEVPNSTGLALASPEAGQRIALTENFRSRPALIEFVNALFNGLMRESFGGVSYEPLQAGIESHRASLGDAPCVELHLLRKESRGESGDVDVGGSMEEPLSVTEQEARLVATRLRELKESGFMIGDKKSEGLRPVEWGDMAVLLRSPGTRAEAFAKEFHRAGIPLAAARAGFLDAIEVSDLINLLRLLDNPLQDIPLLAVLRSPLVGLALDELAAIRAYSDVRPLWWALRRFVDSLRREPDTAAIREPVDAAARTALRDRLDSFLTQFDLWRELARQVGPSLSLERVLADTSYDVLLSVNDRRQEQMANVGLLLDYARQFDPYHRQGLFRFLRFMESLETTNGAPEPAPVMSRNAVQLMSVHRSKGLEFPVVALAALGGRFNLQELNSVLLLDPHYGLAPKALTPSGTARYPTLPFWLAERRQRTQRLGEELRLLYVATTRARDRLILTGSLLRKDQDPETSPSLSDQDLMTARTPLDWLTAWLPSVTQASDQTDDDQGATRLLTWECWKPNDQRLTPPADLRDAGRRPRADRPIDRRSLEAVAGRLSWFYKHPSATTAAAKSSVSALRHRALERFDDEAVHRFAWHRHPTGPRLPQSPPSAAERGTLHHRFLQHIQIARAADVGELAEQLKVFVDQRLFSPSEAELLDLEKVASFWTSAVGRRICEVTPRVRRELPFTVRLEDAEVRSILGQEPEVSLHGEFVVVQGIVDLAVVLENEFWLLDYKTDEVQGEALRQRAREYQPQLRLYAAALERIFRKPVGHQWLHFLAAVETVELGGG